MAETIKIGGELESTATGNKVADIANIKDKTKGDKSQAEINAEIDASLADRYTKAETYSKTQLDNMITTPETAYKDYDTYAEMEAETEHPAGAIYRVANYDGTQAVTNKYAEYSWDGTQYKLMAVREHGIDDEPTAGSNNLIKSGGVFQTKEIGDFVQDNIGFDYSVPTQVSNYLMLKDLPIKFGDSGFYLQVQTTSASRIIVVANNNNNLRVIDSASDNSFINNYKLIYPNWDITSLGLHIVSPDSTYTLKIKRTKVSGAICDNEPTQNSEKLAKSGGIYNFVKNEIQGLDNEISEIQEEFIGYEKSAQTVVSNTNLLTNLNIKNSGCDYYLKVQVESYTRIVVNYNGNTDLRLFDTLTDTSFINNYVKVSLDSAITILGLYLSGVSSATLYLKCVPLGARVTDVLAGKKWYACGDSFTKGGWSYATSQNTFQDEPYKNEYKVYPYYIGRRIPSLEVNNIAVGGMSMCAKRSDPTDDNSFTASGTPNHPTPLYQSIPEDADIVTLYFGINDNNYGCPLGEITDNDNQSFYGAWNEVLTWLINNRPNAKIGIVITNGSAPRFTAAERELAKRYGIPYLDLELDTERVPYLIRQYERTVSGGGDMLDSIAAIRDNDNAVDWQGTPINGHPNEKCHELESTIIENWLRTL